MRLACYSLIAVLTLSQIGSAADPTVKTIELKELDEYTYKSEVLRYNNLSLKEAEYSDGTNIAIGLSVKNMTKNKSVSTRVMVIGFGADGSPLWVASLRPKDSFSGSISADTTDTLTGYAEVPKGTLKATSKLWIRVVERDAK